MTQPHTTTHPRRRVHADDMDTLADALTSLVDLQRELAPLLPPAAAGRITARLDELAEKLSTVGRGRDKHVVGLTAQQLAIAEPDGTVRLLATSSAHEERGRGGLVFFSEEGRECGGLVYGVQEHEGSPSAGAVLAIDQYRQDQIVGVRYQDYAGQRNAGFFVWERPDVDVEDLMRRQHEIEAMEPGPERTDAWDALMREGKMGRYWPTRMFAGRNEANEAMVELHDLEGRVRLRLRVTAAGEAEIQFLDEAGEMQRVVRGRDT